MADWIFTDIEKIGTKENRVQWNAVYLVALGYVKSLKQSWREVDEIIETSDQLPWEDKFQNCPIQKKMITEMVRANAVQNESYLKMIKKYPSLVYVALEAELKKGNFDDALTQKVYQCANEHFKAKEKVYVLYAKVLIKHHKFTEAREFTLKKLRDHQDKFYKILALIGTSTSQKSLQERIFSDFQAESQCIEEDDVFNLALYYMFKAKFCFLAEKKDEALKLLQTSESILNRELKIYDDAFGNESIDFTPNAFYKKPIQCLIEIATIKVLMNKRDEALTALMKAKKRAVKAIFYLDFLYLVLKGLVKNGFWEEGEKLAIEILQDDKEIFFKALGYMISARIKGGSHQEALRLVKLGKEELKQVTEYSLRAICLWYIGSACR